MKNTNKLSACLLALFSGMPLLADAQTADSTGTGRLNGVTTTTPPDSWVSPPSGSAGDNTVAAFLAKNAGKQAWVHGVGNPYTTPNVTPYYGMGYRFVFSTSSACVYVQSGGLVGCVSAGVQRIAPTITVNYYEYPGWWRTYVGPLQVSIYANGVEITEYNVMNGGPSCTSGTSTVKYFLSQDSINTNAPQMSEVVSSAPVTCSGGV